MPERPRLLVALGVIALLLTLASPIVCIAIVQRTDFTDTYRQSHGYGLRYTMRDHPDVTGRPAYGELWAISRLEVGWPIRFASSELNRYRDPAPPEGIWQTSQSWTSRAACWDHLASLRPDWRIVPCILAWWTGLIAATTVLIVTFDRALGLAARGRLKAGLCPRCGYDWAGYGPDPCPECGCLPGTPIERLRFRELWRGTKRLAAWRYPVPVALSRPAQLTIGALLYGGSGVALAIAIYWFRDWERQPKGAWLLSSAAVVIPCIFTFARIRRGDVASGQSIKQGGVQAAGDSERPSGA